MEEAVIRFLQKNNDEPSKQRILAKLRRKHPKLMKYLEAKAKQRFINPQ